MTDQEMLSTLKLYLGSDDAENDLLSALLNRAKGRIMERLYPFGVGNESFPERYAQKAIDIAVYLYGKRGSEGEISHSENGVSIQYESGDIPLSMIRDVVPHAGVF